MIRTISITLCDDRLRVSHITKAIAGFLSCIAMCHGAEALAQAAIPTGQVAAKQFWFMTSQASCTTGKTLSFGARGDTPDEAMTKFIAQMNGGTAACGLTNVYSALPCVAPAQASFTLPLSFSGWEQGLVGDDLIGNKFSPIGQGQEAVASVTNWNCPYEDDPAPGAGGTIRHFDMQIQATCPCGFRINGFTSDALQAVCVREGNPQSACVDKNVGLCASGGTYIANPINPGTGVACKVENSVDYPGSASAQRLDRFERTYSSLPSSARSRSLGRMWRHSFDRSIQWQGSNSVFATRHDGRVLFFELVNNIWTPDVDVSDRLTRLLDVSGNHLGWEYLAAAREERERYDTSGRLVSISTRSGLTQTLVYSDGTGTPPGGGLIEGTTTPLPTGLLLRVAAPLGQELHFSYDQNLRVSQLSDVAGATTRYAYNADGMLAAVRLPDNSTRSYVYNEPANTAGVAQPTALTGINDENGGRFSTYKYDSSGRAISTTHAGGVGQATLTYGTNATTVVDARGTQRTYAFQPVVGVAKNTALSQPAASSPGAVSRSTTYDVNGNLTSQTDFNGNRTNYTYDLIRNLEISRTEGLTAAGGTTAQTRTITTEWDPSFRLPKRIAEPVRITTMAYDLDGTQCGARGALCSKTAQATTDQSGSSAFGASPLGTPRGWTYTYNSNGLLLSLNGPRTDVVDITTYAYYSDNDADLGKRGNVATITNAAGHATSIASYNPYGQPLTIVDPNGLTTTLFYDARQRLTSRSVGSELTTYDYDPVGQLTKITLPDGSFLTYSYDAAHRITGLQDNLGNRIAYALDAMDNRTQEQVFDPANSLAQTRSRVFNNLNRLFQEIGATGQTTTYFYDNQGNIETTQDPLNNPTSNQYDALNRLKNVTDPNGGVTGYAYNGLDALTQVTDPRALVTGYTVDGLGSLSRQVSPDSGTTTNTYDAAGNLLTQTDAKSQTTTYTYDALNRVTQIAFHDGSKQVYVYDLGTNGLGRLGSITERNPANAITSVIAYAYDQHGRVLSETRTVSGVQYVLGNSYDAAGRLSGLTYPSGRTVTYSFDALGRVSQVDTAKSGIAQTVVQNVAYQPFGGVKSFTKGNGQAYNRGYDQDGRIASYTLGASQYAIGYDAASRIGLISDVAVPANSNTYDYDSLDRLTSAVLPSTPFAYGYDAVGNRTSKTIGSGTETYTYGATSNRIATLTPATGPTRSFGFDPNGSTVNDGLNSYVYDARGRMSQATSAVGTTTYKVNALGQRIRKTNSSTDTVFHYDTRGKLIAESDPGGGLYKREFIYLGDIPVMVFQ